MTSKMYYRGMIEDVTNEKCTDIEVSYLASILVNFVKSQARTRAWKSYYRLKDFSGLKGQGVDNFTLILEKETESKTFENYLAIFENGTKKLKIYVKIEEC